MTFQINGTNGKYDNYGKNAVENHLQYMEAPLINDKHKPAPILDFRPTGDAANKNIESMEKFIDENDAYLNSLPPLEYEYRYMPEGKFDKDKDGKIDNSEYAANIVAADILSKDSTDPAKADGVITSKGLNAVLEYSKKSNASAAAKLYANIYNTYLK